MNIDELLSQAKLASEDHVKFARFVAVTEALCDEQSPLVSAERLSVIRDTWFELELINALALDEWESHGKPADWTEVWNSRFRSDAQELVGKLYNLLSL
ncbi:hypothetical protein [Pararobbsia alpina]|nr:hypothetical protein [Pararobbsia alpina]